MVRVRFAPSPTGPVSIGNIRTALYNWLYARHTEGQFLLRIEDTDAARSEVRYETEILDALRWLGLDWDGDIIRQSARLPVYERHLRELVGSGHAYHCFCSKEELETDYQAQLSQGLPPRYSGRCGRLTAAERERRLATGDTAVIRIRIPDRTVSWSDTVRGTVSFDVGSFGDFIIAKGFTQPLYNLACAVDDHETGITHVIRGEDHISNTPKQLVIFEALGFKSRPSYAHLPLILGPDRKKLSKRLLTGSLLDYREAGYLPEAMVNFLALLGWHPREDCEVISVDDMVREFDLARVQKGGAVLNPEKLEWLNGVYLRALAPAALADRLAPFVPPAWLADRPFFERVVRLEQDRLKLLGDFKTHASPYFSLPDYPGAMLQWKKMSGEAVRENLKAVRAAVAALAEDSFTINALSRALTPITEERGRGEVLWPFRVALSGREASPGPADLALVLGKTETERRLTIALEKLSEKLNT